MPDTAAILVNLYNGAREPLSTDVEWMARISDGRQLSERHTDLYAGLKGASKLFNAPFFDNFFDNYTVVVSSNAFQDSGWTPVRIHPTAPETLDLMVLPRDGSLNFANATWKELQASRPGVADIVQRGCTGGVSAADAWGTIMESRPKALACFLNIMTALGQMSLPSPDSGSPSRAPLDFYWNINWPQGDPTSDEWLGELDHRFAQDRFFCYVDAAILPYVREAARNGSFAPEKNPGAFHGDATESYKQTQFDVANVQLTFHGHDAPLLPGPDGTPIPCVKIEPDIDYFKDLGAHGLLEVIPNLVSGNKTDPTVAYMLRWMAGRRAGLTFNPLFTVA